MVDRKRSKIRKIFFNNVSDSIGDIPTKGNS